MIWLFIGSLAGVVMGLTGAGGAIISLPLFTIFLSLSLKQATVVALFVVITASFSNWFLQRKKTNVLLSIGLSILSFMGTRLFHPIKVAASEWMVFFVFAAICAWSLWSIWKPQRKQKRSNSKLVFFLKTMIAGLLMGFSSVMTGLGGGVFLMPVLVNSFQMPYANAVPTSLLSICIGSCFSLYSQRSVVVGIVELKFILIMMFGVVVAALMLKKLLSITHKTEVIDHYRKVLITAIMLFAMTTTLIQKLH